MHQSFALATRQIHLDFHTGPAIAGIGSEFDARTFARTMKEAHVNSVTVFAKCHHGHLYYNTAHPARHPGLKKGLDLLRKQVDALHAVGIRAPIYISVQCDEYAANTHPEWIARNADGTPVGARPLQNPYPHFTWQILDMSSPYQDYLAQQTEEILKQFDPVDGVFFDMCWDQPSTNNYARDAMRKLGMNPESAEERSAYAHQVSIAYMKRFYGMVKSGNSAASCYFNSRPLAGLPEEVSYLTQVEIEALPTGFWGYLYFPKHVRSVRTFGRPYMGMTARFHKSWADFGGIKPYAALEYETSQMMAHGACCSVGDQLHPRGTLDPAAYRLIGDVYQRVEEREPWTVDARPVVEIGVLAKTNKRRGEGLPSDDGVTRMLMQLKLQFNFIDEKDDLASYRLVIVPDQIMLTPEMTKRLEKYVRGGGRLLCTGTSGLSGDGKQVLIKTLGIKARGMSPHAVSYVRFDKQISAGEVPTDHVMYERGVDVRPEKGTRVLARVVAPYFERTWEHFSSHCQSPSDRVSNMPAATVNGRAAYISYPIFGAYAKHANVPCRRLVEAVIRELMPDQLVDMDAPSTMEASLMRQGKRSILHLLQYVPERRGEGLDIVEDIVPVYDIAASVELPAAPKRVYSAPDGAEIAFLWQDGRCHFTVPTVEGHAMIVFE